MDEDCQTVIDLWGQMCSNDAELINDAAQKLYDFFKSPDSVMVVINIAQTCPDVQIKKHSIVNIYRLLRRHIDNISNDDSSIIFQQLLDLLQSEISLNSKNIICDSLCYLYSYRSKNNFEDLYNLSTEMIQSENSSFIPVGIYLISSIIDSDHLSSFSPDLYEFLVNTSLQFLQTPANFDASSFDLFKISYKLFHILLDLIQIEESILTSFEPVFEYLQKTYELVYSPTGIRARGDSDQEAQIKTSSFFDLLSSIATSYSECFTEIFSSIVPEINENLLNEDIPVETREFSLQVLFSVSRSIPELIQEDLNAYIMNAALFAIQLVRQYEDLPSIYLPNDIYVSICKSLLDEEVDESEIFEKFTPSINELDSMETDESLMAIFMILETINKYCSIAIIEEFENILPLLVKGIQSGNSLVLEIISNLTTDFCQADQSSACSLLLSCEPGLIQFANYDFVIDALKEIYDYSEREPTDLNTTMECLLEQVSSTEDQTHLEKVIKCIGYLVLNINSEISDYYSAIHPYLLQLLQSKETESCSPAIFCYSTFASKSPDLVKEDIPQIVDVIINCIPEQDISFDQDAATTILNLIDYFPQSFEEFAPHLLDSLISIVKDKDLYQKVSTGSTSQEDQVNDDDDDDDIEKVQARQKVLSQYELMRDDVFLAISTIFGVYPNELAEQSDDILEIVKSSYNGITFDEEEDDETEALHNLRGFYSSLREIIPGFLKIGKEIDELMNLFLESYGKFNNFRIHGEECIEFWDSLRVIISKCGGAFITKYGDKILEILKSTYSNNHALTFHSQSKSKFCLRNEFIQPISATMNRFFHDFGGNGWLSDPNYTSHAFAERGVEIMHFFIETTNGMKAHASNVIANIILSCGNDAQFDELTEEILNNVFPELINSKVSAVREASYDTIITLLYSENQHALEMLGDSNFIQALLESTQEAIENDSKYNLSLVLSAVILWCGIVMAFDVQFDQEQFEVVISFLPPVPDSSMLEYVAQFAVYAAEKWPEIFNEECLLNVAISVFSSDDSRIRNVKIEYMRVLADILRNTPEEAIVEELHSDENSIQKIHSHVEQVDASA